MWNPLCAENESIRGFHLYFDEDGLVFNITPGLEHFERHEFRTSESEALGFIWSFEVITVPFTWELPHLILPAADIIILIDQHEVDILFERPGEDRIVLSCDEEKDENKDENTIKDKSSMYIKRSNVSANITNYTAWFIYAHEGN